MCMHIIDPGLNNNFNASCYISRGSHFKQLSVNFGQVTVTLCMTNRNPTFYQIYVNKEKKLFFKFLEVWPSKCSFKALSQTKVLGSQKVFWWPKIHKKLWFAQTLEAVPLMALVTRIPSDLLTQFKN